ncbi:hypothetical protein EDD86DRAFT_235878 [Gorgonomyces haynaldii]|nr:hypothetical protein EDD86DRAFT_235878 [Gorgonomyces haynaldii]
MFALIPFVNAALISEIIQADPNLKLAASQLSQNPLWSTANAGITVFVPQDQYVTASANILPSGNYGYQTATRLIDYTTTIQSNYQNVNSTTGTWFIYDDYTPGVINNPEIHVRTGLRDGLVVTPYKLDNGFLYVTNIVIGPAPSLSDVLTAQGCSQYLKALSDTGLLQTLTQARGLTIFAPTDAGFTSVASQYNALTLDQKRATLLYHISGIFAPSTFLQPSFTTFSGVDIAAISKGDHVDVGVDGIFLLGDNHCASGVIHKISKLQFPSPLPSGTFTPVGITIVATPTASAAIKLEPTAAATTTQPSVAAATAKSDADGYVLNILPLFLSFFAF